MSRFLIFSSALAATLMMAGQADAGGSNGNGQGTGNGNSSPSVSTYTENLSSTRGGAGSVVGGFTGWTVNVSGDSLFFTLSNVLKNATYDFTTLVTSTKDFHYNLYVDGAAVLNAHSIRSDNGQDKVYSAAIDQSFKLTSALSHSLKLEVTSIGNGTPTLSSVTFKTTAVPGPIAGAGLPALLGLLGFGLYRRRRAQAA